LFFILCLFAFTNIYAQEGSSKGTLKKIRVKLKNETKRDVWVLLSYVPYTDGKIPTVEETKNNWTGAKGWYRLNAGETRYLFNTYNQVFYFYAHTDKNFWGNQWEWSGSKYIS